MKRIFTLLFVSVFAFTSCSDDGAIGPPGPPGPPGEAGEDGLIGTVLDVEGDFNEANDFSLLVDFDDFGIEVFETDAVLVYLKTGEDGEADGLPVEVFRLLPQTYYIGDEVLQYNFDFTFFEALIFLDGTVDFSTLEDSYTQDQVLRVVVVPAGFASTSGVDVSNMEEVLNALDIGSGEIEKLSIQH